jgi:pre-60S factor REI1
LDKIKTIPQDAAKASPAENGTPSAPKDDVSDEESETLDQKLAASRNRIGVTSCLFCSQSFPSIDASLTHMSQSHGFFIPDADFLVDLPGLITYLGEKIAVHNICIYCNERGREFRSLDAVRKHMVDKSHCKIAYDSEREKLEVSDFYDFSSSYPDVMKGIRVRKVKEGKKAKETEGADEGWEDEDGDSVEVDDVIEEEVEDGAEATSSSEEEESDEEDIPPNEITYGDTPYELVLPSGARIGHRSLKRYYAQSFHPLPPTASSDPKSGQALVRQLLADKNSALVPRRGGFGAFGSGTEVVKARNRGEAKEAGRHIREFRDQQKREQHKTQVGFRHNHQKHYRDPLLQVCLAALFLCG